MLLKQVPSTTSYRLSKPLTPLFIAASPDGLFATPELGDSIRVEYQEDDSSCT